MTMVQLLLFTLDDIRFGLNIQHVQSVVPAVAVTPLPKAPEIVEGVINVHGKICSVVNVRKRFRLPDRRLGVMDKYILASTSQHEITLRVDTVPGLIEIPDTSITHKDDIINDLEYVEGIARLEDGLLLIHDVTTFLSLSESKKLQTSIRAFEKKERTSN